MMDNNNNHNSQNGNGQLDIPEEQVMEEQANTDTQQVEEAVQPEESTEEAIQKSLVNLGFVNFDAGSFDNNTSGALVSEERRKQFRRDVYVGIRDQEQEKEFLGRIVEGPFYAPHEVGIESAITRTTVLNPERTKFRPTYYVSGCIEVLGELVSNERVIVTATRPRPYSEIYIFPEDRLKNLLDINGNFLLGHLMGYTGINVNTDSNSKNFIPRNIGIFGTVGSGKSNTTQVLMEEATKAGWAVIAIDVEGEYVCMNEPTDNKDLQAILKDEYDQEAEGINDFKVYVPSSGHSDANNPESFKVPISGIDVDIIAELMELSEPQVRMLNKVVDQASKDAKYKQTGSRMGVLDGSGASNGNKTYTLQDLIDITSEDDEGKMSHLKFKVLPYEVSTVSTLRSKLINLGKSGMLDWNANSKTAVLPIDELLTAGRLSVLDVSETDDRSRNIAIAYTLQALFEKVITTDEGATMPNGKVRPKVLLIIEEVHTFVSKSTAPKMKAVLDSLQVISRRGRKRWMGLALVSQQPGHVPDELFELANTRFIHQLKSVANLEPVKRTTGGVHEALWTTIPSLGPGQCLITGAIFRNPLFVNMRPAKSKRLLTT